MKRVVERKGELYSPTLIQIPVELKRQAKEHGINLTKVLVDALQDKLDEVERIADCIADNIEGA
ncbi:MAG: hypothetical protein PHI12_13140 [Dehalococcoidales bacterium]|nr:hypothetical protein [Dehalococcoidales bacterium]